MEKDKIIEEYFFTSIQICNELNMVSKKFLQNISKNGNHNCTMAFIFLNRQIELLEAVMILSGQNKFNANSILVRSMLENMAHLYYSNIDGKYAEKWGNYQYIDMLRTVEQKIENGFDINNEQKETLMMKLEKQCEQFVRREHAYKVKESLRKKILPKGDWYNNSWGTSITSITKIVSSDIDRKNKIAIGEGFTKECLRFIYHELSLKSHARPQGFAYEYLIEDDTLKLKGDWVVEDIRTLILAIDFMTRTVDIANTRFNGSLIDALKEIAKKTGLLIKQFTAHMEMKNN